MFIIYLMLAFLAGMVTMEIIVEVVDKKPSKKIDIKSYIGGKK